MSDQLMRYYERELAYVRKALTGFGQRYPEQAAQLHINQGGIEDPNITRLIDGMALLTAKTEQRLDEQMPELVQDLFSLLYPGYNQVSPSYSALVLDTDPEQLNENASLPQGSEFAVPLPDGSQGLFTTCDDLAIYPYQLTSVRAEAAPYSFSVPTELSNSEAVIQLTLSCCDPDATFNQLDLEHFDFYVRGFEQSSDTLIELLLQQTELISLSNKDGSTQQVVSANRMFSRIADPTFQLLPRYGNQFPGFDLLRDYFTYPDKAAYFRIEHLGRELATFDASTVVINFFVRSLPAEFLRLFDTSVFCLNTVPALNLFEQRGEPLNYDFSCLSIPVMADAYANSGVEVVSVQQVREVLPDGERPLRPLYQARYRQEAQSRQWQSRQRWDEVGQRHIELTLSCEGVEAEQDSVVLALDLLCSNGRTPCLVAAGTEVECLAAIDLPGSMSMLTAPTSPQYPPADDSLYWRFIALLNTNFSSLLQTDHPVQALKDVLALCCHNTVCLQAEAVKAVQYKQQVAAMNVCHQNIFATGTEVEITLDAETLSSQSAVLGEVLNAFYQQFCSFDRFMQVTVSQFGSDGTIKAYPQVHGSQLCL